ncbi:MAG: WYL domain-containing protein [Myxococcales bacterium]|nr:WYL domain-containing protein [Myxococcales bacterium]
MMDSIAMGRGQSERSGQRRLLRMLASLMTGAALDRNSAATKFGVNPEGAHTLLKRLESEIPGVEKRKRGRIDEFYFVGAATEEPLTTTRSSVGFAQALAASFASAFARVFAGTRYARELVENRRSVIAELASTRQRHFGNIGRKVHVRCGQEELLEDRETQLDEVLDAILRQRVATMRYRRFGGDEQRITLRPLTLAVYDSHLYVVGATADSAAYPFRFARILEFEVLDQRFEYPGAGEYDPEAVFHDSFGIFVDPDPCDVRLRLDSRWSVFARHHRWHASQRIERELDDGSLLLSFHVRPCKELEQWLLGLGEHVEVLEPESLRVRISERLASAVRRYDAV